jgi:plasmid stability protein
MQTVSQGKKPAATAVVDNQYEPTTRASVTPSSNSTPRMWRLDGTTFVRQFWHMSATLTIRLPDDLAQWLQNRAKQTGRSQASLIKECLESARRGESKPYMKLAGALEGPSNLSQRRGFRSR